ncbi:hypothetical protein IKF27_00425 [Candidatus Saccharibacteria bacterium]|nr:hypothetical protein [Candidatus Saccharibacteria bacterium]
MKIKDEAVLTKILEGADIEEISTWLSPEEQLIYFKWLEDNGLVLHPDSILKKTLEVTLTAEQIKELLEYGASPLLLAEKLHDKLMLDNLSLLIDYGLEPEKVYTRLLSPEYVIKNLNALAENGVFIPRPNLIKLRKFVREH